MVVTLDNESSRTYTRDELRKYNIMDENWIQRSVALSRESNEKIVNLSIQHLKDKKELTNNPHKIIAVACSIKHAEDIQKIYKEKGYESSDRKSTRLNSSHVAISYAVFCLKKKNNNQK